MKHHILPFLLTALLLTSCEPTDPTQLVWCAGETGEIEPVIEEVYEDGTTAILSDTLTGYQVDMLIRE